MPICLSVVLVSVQAGEEHNFLRLIIDIWALYCDEDELWRCSAWRNQITQAPVHSCCRITTYATRHDLARN